MLKNGSLIRLSASDLVGHLHCGHLTNLDIAVAKGTLPKPKVWDPMLEVLRERGARHEKEFVRQFEAGGSIAAVIEGNGIDSAAVQETVEAMKTGVDVIVQGALEAERWSGRSDVLKKIPVPSQLGPWSYEVIDTKLTRETKAGTVLQLSLYSELVSLIQGIMPEHSYVVVPGNGFEPKKFRTANYGAYFRRVKASLAEAVDRDSGSETYPSPKPYCDICRWRVLCEAKRRADDHLCLVAGISKIQIEELGKRGVQTVASLAEMPVPLNWKPRRGSSQSYVRIREQARIQVQGREAGAVLHETLAPEQGFGLSCLPEPSFGDVFLDFEGDPFVDHGGLEYLVGYAYRHGDGSPAYVADWALSRAEEKLAFQRFVDFVMHRLQQFPNLHIYHYAPYEPVALKRLMGRHACREDEIDWMLRSKLFVDLYSVVKHGIRASVESYSIKRLEPLYDFTRRIPLDLANGALAKVQSGVELGNTEDITEQDRAAVQGYNRDDCYSTWYLRDWLEGLRQGLVNIGVPIERPIRQDGTPNEALSEWQQKIVTLITQLTSDIPEDANERSPEQQGRWLLAHTLDFHRREQKATWWEYYRLCDLSAEELMDERGGLAGLQFEQVIGGSAKAPIHRYSFPVQETELRGGEKLHSLGGMKFGQVHDISLADRWIDIKKRKDCCGTHPQAIFTHRVIEIDVLAEALVRIGEHVAKHGLAGEGAYQGARDLLMLEAPRTGESLQRDDETTVEAACRVIKQLNGGILPIQGPPGSGKTFTGARMICTLVEAGYTVGITANSHKVIRHFLQEVDKTADELGMEFCCIEKVLDEEDDQGRLQFTTDNATLLNSIGSSCPVAAGTAWVWALEESSAAVDVLFVDEAAQMSLANVLAISQAARTIVLLGDPQQLQQPTQGSHPEGTDVSALEHILGDHQTIPAGRGLFLEQTWRLHPAICAFTSELFYEGRLHSHPGLERQEIRCNGRVKGAGLRYLPVYHEGNQNSSPEEADEVRALVTDILNCSATWVDGDGVERPMGLNDILIVAPYNAQVFELQDRLPLGARIGTVDKFQGQQAALVIYSMTTSTYADAPRGMEFLYSANRFNVATSRAKCICILVASPTIFEAECRTPRQMQLANSFCRYLELAIPI